jgi:hypothetical protein
MNELHDKIYELETSLLTPEVRSSFEQLDALLADDFVEFGSTGLIYTKQSVLERLPKNTDTVVFNVSDFTTKRLAEDIMMANFKTERIINDTEKMVSLRTSLWRNNGGHWQMFFHQGTLLR